ARSTSILLSGRDATAHHERHHASVERWIRGRHAGRQCLLAADGARRAESNLVHRALYIDAPRELETTDDGGIASAPFVMPHDDLAPGGTASTVIGPVLTPTHGNRPVPAHGFRLR